METPERALNRWIDKPSHLAEILGEDLSHLTPVTARYPMRISRYYLGLIREAGDPIWRQAVPDPAELEDTGDSEDPLAEEKQSPLPNVVHRYPDRALFLVSHQCAMHCRFCTRKRKVGRTFFIGKDDIRKGLEYIAAHPELRDIILSGGDPLMLPDETLEAILKELRAIPHVEILRIGSRIPCTWPQRITPRLTAMLKKYHPLYLNTHFNHPAEITPESTAACGLLADAGIPLGCQTVLLKGVNDSPEVMLELMRGLLRMRVKPYYLYQADLAQGTHHFRTRVETGLEIMQALRGYTSGLAVPAFVIDAPGGKGKIPLLPGYCKRPTRDLVRLRNYRGKISYYRQVKKDAEMEFPETVDTGVASCGGKH
ncbi:MAG: KamA family radical SAM protein [Planctomycetes bacterium]|nr:KamA family radical SAM protein [Planctomycetota bacterium]